MKVLPALTMIAVVAAGAAGLFVLGKRRAREAKDPLREFEELTGKEGHLYFCPCGRPKDPYYWVHYVLCIFTFPYGLVSLFFKLKKCRNCGRGYKEDTRVTHLRDF